VGRHCRPALVLWPRAYHQRTPYAAILRITSRVKGYPFEVPLAVTGAVLTDQVESIDRHARRIEVAGQAPDAVVAEVTERITALLGG
jgi:mRNA interferase MazF